MNLSGWFSLVLMIGVGCDVTNKVPTTPINKTYN
jgi:hypothetical protein